MSSSIVISIGPTGERSKRDKKGKSLIEFPEKYIVLDIETTGLSPEYDSIIEIAALKIENGQCIDSFSSLVKPGEIYVDDNDEGCDFVINEDGEKVYYVDAFISELTGITNTMLHDAPEIDVVIPLFKSFIGNSIVVGHNVNFDINFLYDYFIAVMDAPLDNNFIDIMRIARRIIVDIKNHRLKDIAEYYSVSSIGSHRALRDCEITNSCFVNLKEDIVVKYGNVESFIPAMESMARNRSQAQKAKNIHTSIQEFDIYHQLYNKRCVFTGTLERMVRKDAMQIVADHGGISEDNITSKTNYLILGNNDYCSTIKDGKSGKQKKAEAYKLKGNDIEILPENVFYDMINEK